MFLVTTETIADQKISEVKEAQGHNILDSTRELEVLNRAQQAIKTPAYQETILQTLIGKRHSQYAYQLQSICKFRYYVNCGDSQRNSGCC